MTVELAKQLTDEELYLVTNYQELNGSPDLQRLILEIVGKLARLHHTQGSLQLLEQVSGLGEGVAA